MNGRDPFFGFGDPFANFGGFGDPFANFGGPGGPRDLMSSVFGGRDPFADPFFTRPFGGMFESGFFGSAGNPFVGAQPSGFLGNQPPPPPPRSRGPVIEELNSDEEKDEKEGASEKKDNPRKHGRSSNEPLVEIPDDEAEGRRRKQMQFWNGGNMSNIAPPQHTGHSFSFQSSTVTYSGGNGAYYTSSTTRRTGSDGLTFEERKEADSATRQAAHQVSRGIHGKGHSVSRKLNSDGRVDTMQTLHNLEEDELTSFEEKWKGSAARHFPGWSEGRNTLDYGSKCDDCICV
ncbi:OLC1v1029413C2 [Oldenlandia corymbosa var. corymbosa]|uniref:OLC1v1029413C2 n=1 Tax=Oldenlandia corymbosa var. corymbosa TaxID=529605 RepID=A0AAV1CDU7_OLDCO|nr:OLC1v1029413C2 [Oldenlandia corymbosa var. corymbosa]